MQFMLMIYEDEKVYGPNQSAPAMQEIVAKHMAFSRELGSRRVGGGGLRATTSATTVRTTNGRQAVLDGPFAETKEQLGGFYIIDVPDLDAAVAVAKKMPLYRDGAIEVRALLGPN